MAGRGKKLSYDKDARAHDEWMAGKKLGRPKQVWVDDTPTKLIGESEGHWEKVSQS